MTLLFPQDEWNSARGDTTLVITVFSGIFAGLWFTHALTTDFIPEADSPPFPLEFPGLGQVGMAALRHLVGVIFVLSVSEVFKYFVLRIVCHLTGHDHKDPTCKKHLEVELPYRYTAYFLTSCVATYIVPLIFLKLGIERPAFYSEVFNLS